MRARRPELFSDSEVLSTSTLTREALEYHLEVLTSRTQENDFEYFCRKLAENELCPNLVPQTGPTGGGDSKVDSETYPVADAISDRWYEGLGQDAARERWAFAFSAKKAWKPKVTSDVKAIVGTGRDYKRIFFLTNQFVRDKSRAATEDALTKKYNVPTRILDRTWIVERVFTNKRTRLAIEALRLSGYDEERKISGPLDVERETELQDLEQQIADDEHYRGVEYQLVEDCLHAATVSRGLGHPRREVDGRFMRAARLAERFGGRSQQARIS